MKIVRTQVQTGIRRLSDQWTVELSQEITTHMSQELQQEIDKEIMDSLIAEQLQSEGWIRVPIDGDRWLQGWAQWMEENLDQDDVHVCIGCVLFRRGEDAVAYTLRWS